MKRLFGAVALLVLASCTPPPTPTTWSKPGSTDEELAQDTARCRLAARAFSSEGPAPYPGASTIGGEFANLRRERHFGDCMTANGYRPQTAQTEAKSNPDPDAPGEPNNPPQ